MMKFIPYVRQSIDESDIEAVGSALKGDLITRGPKVEEFEKALATYCDVQYVIAFSSGTAALMAAYQSAGLTESDRLVTTPNTFVATVGAALHCGTQPIFCDIDRNTGSISLDQACLNMEEFEATRGRPVLAPVHFAGPAIDMLKLEESLRHPEAIIIEDAAHAFGSFYPSGEKVGSCAYSAMTMFSFHATKTIATGEGGAVTTNQPELYKRLRQYRDNGIERDASRPWYYEVQEITGNYHMTEMQAALGLSQLKRVDEMIKKKRNLVKRYRKNLAGVPHIRLLNSEADAKSAYHLFVVQIDFAAYKKKRGDVMLALREKGIGTQVHYIPVYKHPYFSKGKEDLSAYFPETEAYYAQALSLPLYVDLTEREVDDVCKTLIDLLRH